MGKILRLLGTCLTAAFLLGSLPHISQAAEVKAERDIIQTERQDGREFCLRYQVRAEDALGLRKPGRLLIVVDNSLWAADLAEEPLGQAYEEGKPHKAIKEGETLYMEQEGRFLPVSLREGQWKASGGQTAGERTAQGDVFSRPLYTKGEAQTKSEHIREAVQALLESLVQDAPDTEIGILRAGGRVDVSSVVAAGEGKEVLKAFLEEQKPQGQQNFPAALTLAADLAEESSLPVCLVILAAGTEPLSGEKALLCQSQVQRIRELGGRSFVGVLEDLEKENDAFWQSLASAPGEEHCFFQADPALCLEAAGKYTAGAFQVEIRERLDPRFTLSLPEQGRLEKAGAQVQQAEGMWQVSWPVELYGDRPWEGDLTVEARTDFPGGQWGACWSGRGRSLYPGRADRRISPCKGQRGGVSCFGKPAGGNIPGGDCPDPVEGGENPPGYDERPCPQLVWQRQDRGFFLSMGDRGGSCGGHVGGAWENKAAGRHGLPPAGNLHAHRCRHRGGGKACRTAGGGRHVCCVGKARNAAGAGVWGQYHPGESPGAGGFRARPKLCPYRLPGGRSPKRQAGAGGRA